MGDELWQRHPRRQYPALAGHAASGSAARWNGPTELVASLPRSGLFHPGIRRPDQLDHPGDEHGGRERRATVQRQQRHQLPPFLQKPGVLTVSQQHHPLLNFRHFGGDFFVRRVAEPYKMRLVFGKKRRARLFDDAQSLKGLEAS